MSEISELVRLDLKSAIDICAKPESHRADEVVAACKMLASYIKDNHLDEPELKSIKHDVAATYIAIYKGDEIKEDKCLKKLYKYLSSASEVYKQINKELKKSVPEIGLIAKYINRDKEIVEDILGWRSRNP